MTTVAESTGQSLHPDNTGSIDIPNPVSELIKTAATNPKMELFWDRVRTIYAFGLLGFGLFFPFALVAWKILSDAG